MTSPQLTVLTVHYGISWFIQRTRSKDEEKTEMIYRIPCKNCPSSYIGETDRKLGLRMKEHRKEADSFTAGTQTRASIQS